MTVFQSVAALAARQNLPDVPIGTVVELGPDDWSYSYGWPLRLCVERCRTELARFYGWEQVWLEGWELSGDEPRCWRSALVRVSALRKLTEIA